ncbi:23S rRNA (uracil(1939)-C(5))-methyltransferase RlmD [Lacrimispora celerecrescens]|uniref:23S rRNA (uracil(1939)-C(5))-methyltransferase RlmD n=1 Tax=Lacrimispora celerecrescens TaxID=29354 RepID=UPI001FA6E705|nr:23S rRNA (uracil(1939)-C(5))-methyltransferase RlmD [Lacrimispora celerecrescens]
MAGATVRPIVEMAVGMATASAAGATVRPIVGIAAETATAMTAGSTVGTATASATEAVLRPIVEIVVGIVITSTAGTATTPVAGTAAGTATTTVAGTVAGTAIAPTAGTTVVLAVRKGTVEIRLIGQAEEKKKSSSKCPVSRTCGGCQLLDMPYEKQLEQKQKHLEKLLKPYCHVAPIIGMENPYHYRNKVHAVFDHDKKGNPVSGVYEVNSHRVVPVENCMIEDQKADEIIGTIRGMLKSFKIRTYDEDTGYGLLRHVLIRRGFATGEVMVVLVTASPIFPSKNNFVKALREKHPEITTIIQNVNGRDTSMVLGDKEHVLYGKGYIEDILCGCRFHISSKSFYQVNPVQTEILYNKAIEAAGLTGKERVVDAYCGIGTIGIVASKYAKEVIGVEQNRDAVRDAVENAKINGIKNVKFFCNDAGKFMMNMAEDGEHVDVVFMDPPRSGSTEEFIDSVVKVKAERVVYVSCGPETLVRDLEYFRKKGYEAKMGWGVDLFPATEHCEIIVELNRK